MAARAAKAEMVARTEQTSPPALFLRQLFAHVMPDDLAALSGSARAALAASLWRQIAKRPRGLLRLRLVNPTLETEGWAVDHTVIEIVSDDMPFLVDSITAELQRRGLAIHLCIHPVMHIERDAQGGFLRLRESRDQAGANEAESLMHIQIDRCLEPALLEALARDLRAIVEEAGTVVADWPTMRRRADETVAEMAALDPAAVTPEEAGEARQFLNWLCDNNFTFLGYRDIDLVRGKDAFRWKVARGSGLGVLRDDETRMFGGLRDLAPQPPEIQRLLRQRRSIVIAKTTERSRIHRPVPMDAIFVQRFNAQGEVIGERLFIGLFTSSFYTQSPGDVPFLRHKIMQVLTRASFDPMGHNGRSLLHILDNYPRDELFQVDLDLLYEHALGILQLQERARVALFLRQDIFNRYMTCLIYVPREHYDSRLRQRMQRWLETAFGGAMTDQTIRVGDSPLARVFFTITMDPSRPRPSHAELEAGLRELCRSWQERLRDGLLAEHGEAAMLGLMRRYGEAFPPAYCDTTAPADAVRDVRALETARQQNRFVVDLGVADATGLLRLKLFQPGHALVLSEILPLIENMGLKVEYTGGPHEVAPREGDRRFYVHEFVGRPGQTPVVPFAAFAPVFEETLARVMRGDAENDAFNALTLRTGLPWREVMALRALARYLRQLRIPYSHEMIAATLLAHPAITVELARFFLEANDPALRGDRAARKAACVDRINAGLAEVQALEEDRIIRRYLNLIQSVLRTNYFQQDAEGAPKPWLSLKFNSRALEYIPLPKPWVEVFVYSPRVEAVHLRGGKVARGGVRWSDRKDDFRNEILGLMKAQMVKNSVIVPVGSKGGFIVKQPPQAPDKMQAEGVACYQIMIRGLLDITDNRVGKRIVPPPRVVRHDGDDPYLVVAADKGTATFSDIANALAQDYGFWLDDAFASGGSAGYDHKQMGITARGAWEAIKRHFRELGKDIQKDPFTCVGVGDMSGDVFGNGMLLSKATKLVAAFDHRHIFCDPDPDPAASHAERQRLFALPRSSWNDYNRKLLSKGGAVFARSEKTLRLTPEIRKAFGLAAETLTPAELIQALLKAKVDLLYFGGIGTYVKAAAETQDEVADRANEPLRVNGAELQASVVGEGANLAMTQRARIEYAAKGGRLNTDAIDNSAGVGTSDREVNIKILLRGPVVAETLSLKARNKLLASMTDEVARLILRDNYLQTQALTLADAEAVALLPQHARTLRALERSGLLNRAVEFLPDEAEVAKRQKRGRGLRRPEMAVLLSYAKIALCEAMLASDLPDDPEAVREHLVRYFPEALRKPYAKEIAAHQLRREIVATALTNDIVNRAGGHFVTTLMETTGRAAPDVVRAWLVAVEAFGLRPTWREIEAFDNKVPAATQTAMFLAINRMLADVTGWFLAQPGEIPSGKAAALFGEGAQRLSAWFAKNPHFIAAAGVRETQEWIRQGVPEALARRVGMMPCCLATMPDLTRLATTTKQSVEQAAAVWFGLAGRLGLDWLREKAGAATGATAGEAFWQREATAAVLEDLNVAQRRLVAALLARGGKDVAAALEAWSARNAHALERYDATLAEMRAAGSFDVAMLVLASRQLALLAKGGKQE